MSDNNQIYLNDMGILCALGCGKDEVEDNMLRGYQGGMIESSNYSQDPLVLGVVQEKLPQIPPSLSQYSCRNNQMLLHVMRQLRPSLDQCLKGISSERVGVILGTCTGGNSEAQDFLNYYSRHHVMPSNFNPDITFMGDCADFVADYLKIRGPRYVMSTACSSSGNAIASAARMIRNDLCDLVIVGGADALCSLTVRGFSALGVVCDSVCNPSSINRKGANIGEGAALFIMSKKPADVRLEGVGVCSEAFHISKPRPDGSGATKAMSLALHNAGLPTEDIHYVNLHGTATELNDAMEHLAVNSLFGPEVPCSSTKSMTGHALGAAAAIEAAICWTLLKNTSDNVTLPVHCWDGQPDEQLATLNLVGPRQESLKLKHCMSNSFAFGGNNVSLIFGRA
ncbi:MAG: beta-ketoacyl-ACP synthase [Lysobacterales bacterium]|nr:MAG: beta-ketoacyl-ACP synthase [Xanthomonadales bacterium]